MASVKGHSTAISIYPPKPIQYYNIISANKCYSLLHNIF